MPRRPLLLGFAALLALADPLPGQTPRAAVSQMFTFGTCGQPLCLDLLPDSITGVNHGLHFIKATETSGGTVISFLTSAIGFSVSNTPITSSSSGTTFRFEGGAPVATSTSGGPIFGERAQTLGRGRWFLGFGFSQVQFERLNGVSLSDIVFNFTHQNVGDTTIVGSPALERDFIQMRLDMSVNLLVASFSTTYGLMEGVDVGVTVPFVRTSVSGHSTAEIFLVGGDTLHHFAGTGLDPVLTATASAAGIASGVGDVDGHLKIRVSQSQHFGIALLGSARFPTGDEGNLLGSGAFSARALGIVSARFGGFNPHGYVGYTFRNGDLQTNSVEGNAGFDNLLAPWATMAFDILGSWQVGASKIGLPSPVQYNAPFPYTLQVTNLPSRRDDFLSMSFGFKFRTRRGIQLVTNALFPLRDAGLQPQAMWTGGLEYSF
jgi:hypothetical protein